MSKGKTGSLINRIEFPSLAMTIVIMIIVSAINHTFLKPDNLLDVLRTTSYNFIIAAPLTCLMVCGEMDLSFGAVVSLSGIACGWALHQNMPIVAAILVALAVGFLLGLLKAFLLCNVGLPGFITTLGLQYAVNGLVLLLTQGQAISQFPDSFKVLGQGGPLPKVYWTIIVALVLGIMFHFVLSRTRLGRSFYAVGGNKETARLAGININSVTMTAHILVSMCASLAGVFKAARFNSAQPAAGSGTELLIMSAIIIGGTGIAGGTGTVIGAVIGCFLMAVIDNGLILIRISTYWNNLIFGTVLILALAFDLYRRSKIASVKK